MVSGEIGNNIAMLNLDILPHREKRQPREPVRCKGQIEIPADFTETSEEIIATFEGTRLSDDQADFP